MKKTEERIVKRLEHGLRVKGTGVGERVKGKTQERTLKARYVYFISSVDEGFEGLLSMHWVWI